jgi:hypothetical protein
MTVCGKHGKTVKPFYRTLSTDLGNRSRDYHIPAATTTTAEIKQRSSCPKVLIAPVLRCGGGFHVCSGSKRMNLRNLS